MKGFEECLFLVPFLGINAVTDMKKRQISLFTVPLFIIAGIAYQLWNEKADWVSLSAGIALAFFLLGLSFLSKQAIGFGDGLVVLVCAVFLGFAKSIVLVMGGFLLASFAGVVLLICKRANKKTPLPFVPFLMISYVIQLAGGLVNR